MGMLRGSFFAFLSKNMIGFVGSTLVDLRLSVLLFPATLLMSLVALHLGIHLPSFERRMAPSTSEHPFQRSVHAIFDMIESFVAPIGGSWLICRIICRM